ncbi:MAG TPA: WecB/TagA/CpsF family glycosyltransferase [Vicinamibacteria bacterium]|nr:WecB/TagA/CpsF family glycosyltransferase [Vicinamibacteria bacterium]
MTRRVAVVDFGPVHAHAVSLPEAVEVIARRAKSGGGGYVLTPNVDHISVCARNTELAAAYRRCFLSLADGMPLVLLSRLLRLPLRQKVSGSDLFEPLMARCARDGLPVFFLGATDEVCAQAERKLRRSFPSIQVTGWDSSVFDLAADPGHALTVVRRARERGTRLIIVCLPAGKQTLLARFEDDYRPAVGIGAGSALAFYVGEVRRAPPWMSRCALEWLYRLSCEPRRLWRRYLVEAAWVVPVFLRLTLDRLSGRSCHRVCTLPLG